MVLRDIVRIDEERCTGCGLCVTACAEEAIRIVDGKARLISEKYCDGLGACIGECPEGAITIEKRESEEFDEKAVEEHLKARPSVPLVHHVHGIPQPCPSARAMCFEGSSAEREAAKTTERSMLSHWPVQLALVPPNATFFEKADLLIAADCVPFAYPSFHNHFLKEKTLLVGCPKLDDSEFYRGKLTEILKRNDIRSVTVVNMEVPCCFGLYRLVKESIGSSGKNIPMDQKTISLPKQR